VCLHHKEDLYELLCLYVEQIGSLGLVTTLHSPTRIDVAALLIGNEIGCIDHELRNWNFCEDDLEVIDQ